MTRIPTAADIGRVTPRFAPVVETTELAAGVEKTRANIEAADKVESGTLALQHKFEDTEAREKLVELNKIKRELIYGSPTATAAGPPGTPPTPGFTTLYGNNAVKQYANHLELFAQARERINRESSSDRVRGLIAPNMLAATNDYESTLGRHAMAEQRKHDQAVLKAGAKEALQTAIAEAHAGSDGTLSADAITKIQDSVDAVHKLTYKRQIDIIGDKAEALSTAESATTNVHVAVIRNLIKRGEEEAALDYYNAITGSSKYSKGFDTDVRGDLIKEIREGARKNKAYDLVTKLMTADSHDPGSQKRYDALITKVKRATSGDREAYQHALEFLTQEFKIEAGSKRNLKLENTKAVLEAAWGKIGTRGVVLTNEEIKVLKQEGKYALWVKNHQLTLLGDPGVTDGVTQKIWESLTVTQKAAIPEVKFFNEWMPKFANRSGSPDVLTQEQIKNQWEAARAALGKATAAAKTASEADIQELVKASSENTYSDVFKTRLAILGLSGTTNAVAAGKLRSRIMAEIRQQPKVLKGEALSDAEVEKIFDRMSISIDWFGPTNAPLFQSQENEEKLQGIPPMMWDEIAALAATKTGEKEETAYGVVPLVDPKDMQKIWTQLKKAGKGIKPEMAAELKKALSEMKPPREATPENILALFYRAVFSGAISIVIDLEGN